MHPVRRIGEPVKRIIPLSTTTGEEYSNEGVSEGHKGIRDEGIKGTNCVAFGQARDERIVQLIQSGTAFTRKQIELIIFPKRKSSKRIAQYSLARLFEQQRVKKWVRAAQLPTIYYHHKPKRIDHVLTVNEIYCELLRQKKNYSIEWKWDYSILGGMVVADAMLVISIGQERRVIFIEVELHPGKRFDKPEIYKKVFDANWIKEEWSVMRNNTAVFPAILIVTDDKLVIRSELNFIVASLEQVQKDVYGLLLRR